MKVLLISGSLRRPSYTTALLRHIAVLLAARGAETELWDLKDRPLPIFDPEFEDADPYPDPAVQALSAAARAADAIVVASPNYHNSLSGALKNALDFLGPEFRHKAVGIAAHGHGVSAGQPADHLRIIVRSLLAYAATTQVVTVPEDYDTGYRLTNSGVLRRAERFADELVFLSGRLRAGATVTT